MNGILGVRIRGIYATALTKLMLERGFAVADPSPRIQERFGLHADGSAPDVVLEDREDRQGVALRGTREAVATVQRRLQEALEDACFWQAPGGRLHTDSSGATTPEEVRVLAEFPATAKARLDRIRGSILPTLPGHHYLKTIDPEAVDRAEEGLRSVGSEPARLAEGLKRRLVYRRLRPGADAPIQHVKPGVRTVLLRGKVASLEGGALTLHRLFQAGGLYDSLNVPKLKGDWGTLVLPEGDWVSTRRYFRKSGELIGEIYNIGTPTEFYADHVRYVDLEVDVVRWGDGRVKVVDQNDLREQVERGNLPASLADKATAIAEELAEKLGASAP